MRSLLKSEPFPSHNTSKQLSMTINSSCDARRPSSNDHALNKYIRYIRENEFFKKNTKKSTLASILIITTCIIENELSFQYGYQFASTMLRLLICLTSLWTVWLIVDYYRHLSMFMRLSKKMHKTTPLWKEPLFKFMTMELLVNAVFLPPYVNATFKFYQLNTYNTITLDDMFVMVYMARAYHIVKFIHHHSPYNNQVGHFFCNLVYKSYTMKFSIRAFIKDYAISAVCLGGFFVSVVSGILLRIFERTTPDSSFYDFWTAFWVISATQTTLGYGEYKPFSHMGRFVCMATCLLSVFLSSYLVIIFQNWCDLKTDEQNLLSQIICKRTLDKKTIKKGILFLQRWWRFMLKRHKKLPRFKEFSAFFQSFHQFQLSRSKYIAFKNLGLEHEINTSQFFIESGFTKFSKSLALLDQIKRNLEGIIDREFKIMKTALSLHNKKDRYNDSAFSKSQHNGRCRIRLKKSMDIAWKRVINNIHS